MTESQHTPTPWRVAPDGLAVLAGDERDPVQVCVLAGDWCSADDEESRVNAAYIVRACNAHDALVEALNELDANCENRQEEPFIKYVRATCRAALAKAEGR